MHGVWTSPIGGEMSEHESTVRRFTERYAAALSQGDLDAIVDSWGVPAIVISDQGVQPVAAADEVEAFFGAATRLVTCRESTRP
jgi:ketosteroid isomerase-like protein